MFGRRQFLGVILGLPILAKPLKPLNGWIGGETGDLWCYRPPQGWSRLSAGAAGHVLRFEGEPGLIVSWSSVKAQGDLV